MKRIVLLLLLFPIFVSAKPIINEIAWMGNLVDEVDAGQEWRYEWIELFNDGSEVSLDAWSIELYRDELDFVIPLSGIISSGEYLVIGASDKIKGVDVSYNNLGGKFMNGGQRVVLRDGSGSIVEEVDMREGWFGGNNRDKKTMERKDLLYTIEDVDNWGTSLLVNGTPGSKNTLYGTYGKEVALDFREFKKDPKGSSGSFAIYSAAVVVAILSSLTLGFLYRRLRLPFQ